MTKLVPMARDDDTASMRPTYLSTVRGASCGRRQQRTAGATYLSSTMMAVSARCSRGKRCVGARVGGCGVGKALRKRVGRLRLWAVTGRLSIGPRSRGLGEKRSGRQERARTPATWALHSRRQRRARGRRIGPRFTKRLNRGAAGRGLKRLGRGRTNGGRLWQRAGDRPGG